jgi:hypothetical protein
MMAQELAYNRSVGPLPQIVKLNSTIVMRVRLVNDRSPTQNNQLHRKEASNA